MAWCVPAWSWLLSTERTARSLWVLLGMGCYGLLACPVAAPGHRMGESYLFLSVGEGRLEGRWEVMLSDLDRAVDVDGDEDGKVSDEELAAAADRVRSYLSERVQMAQEGIVHPLRHTRHETMSTPSGRYGVFHFTVDALDPVPAVWDLHYAVLFDQDPRHRGLLLVEEGAHRGEADVNETVWLVFTPRHSRQRFDLRQPPSHQGFLAMARHGMEHIWVGIDHLLFLLALALPAVGMRQERGWQPTPTFRPAFINILKIVTLFTLAHSITLALASLGIVELPSRLVEAVIAASVGVAALNNIYPLFPDRIGWLVFGFGLFHGFGFASQLTELGLRQGSLLVSLLGFNLGVEIGQMVLLALAFPLLYLLRRSASYPRLFLRFGSALVATVALVWFVERVFELGPILRVL